MVGTAPKLFHKLLTTGQTPQKPVNNNNVAQYMSCVTDFRENPEVALHPLCDVVLMLPRTPNRSPALWCQVLPVVLSSCRAKGAAGASHSGGCPAGSPDCSLKRPVVLSYQPVGQPNAAVGFLDRPVRSPNGPVAFSNRPVERPNAPLVLSNCAVGSSNRPVVLSNRPVGSSNRAGRTVKCDVLSSL